MARGWLSQTTRSTKIQGHPLQSNGKPEPYPHPILKMIDSAKGLEHQIFSTLPHLMYPIRWERPSTRAGVLVTEAMARFWGNPK